MGRIIYYVASSVDGYIADEKGSVEWLEPFQDTSSDYGYGAFYKTIGSVITGSGTFEQVSDFPGGWNYPGATTYLFSSRIPDISERQDILHWREDIGTLAKKLRSASKNAWLVGGANLAGQFFRKGAIDEIILTVMPVVLGKGVPLLKGVQGAKSLELRQVIDFPKGVVQMHYQVT